MEKNGEKKQRRLKLYLILLLIATSVLGPITFSRYMTALRGADSATVAKARLQFIGGGPDISDLAPGETKYYEFQIVNVDELDTVSDVALKYSFTFAFTAQGSAPLLDLTYDLYYKPTPSSAQQHVGMTTGDPAKSNPVVIGHTDAETHTFFLAITWNATQQDPGTYANIVNSFTILTQVEQVD